MTNKVVWTWKDDWVPQRTSTYERPFTQEGNYLVIVCTWKVSKMLVYILQDLCTIYRSMSYAIFSVLVTVFGILLTNICSNFSAMICNILKLNYSHFKFKFHTTIKFQLYSNIIHLNNYYPLDFFLTWLKVLMLPINALIDYRFVQ